MLSAWQAGPRKARKAKVKKQKAIFSKRLNKLNSPNFTLWGLFYGAQKNTFLLREKIFIYMNLNFMFDDLPNTMAHARIRRLI